jgi:hypothetical protein
MVKEFEPWRKSFILQLYESTKDAVEVARRNYLEGRLANGLKREMHEMREKYEDFCKLDQNQAFMDNLDEFRSLEEEVDAGIVQLKERSDQFVAISSGGWPYKVEYLTYDEVLRAKLPDYTRFLFNPQIISFGPISERWETLKTKFSKEFMNLVDMSPRLSMGRSYSTLSVASSVVFSVAEAGAEEEDEDETNAGEVLDETNEGDTIDEIVESDVTDEANGGGMIVDGAGADDDNVTADIESPNPGITKPTRPPPTLPPKTTAFSKEEAESPAADAAEGSSKQKVKPPVLKRKQHSFKRTLSGAWSQILSNAAQSAESRRVVTRTSDHRKTGVYIDGSDPQALAKLANP